jgi:suppressor for copper-sensitivity B
VGVEIKLKGMFKTYWRVPGDAGVPPVFDWSSSKNAGSIALRWPVPARFVDAGVTTIGYKDRVIFPAVVRAAEPGKPLTLTLALDYAVCDRICIPAKASATLALPEAAETDQTSQLDAFRALTPRMVEPGKGNGGLGLGAVSWIPEKGRQAVELTVTMGAGASLGDAFLEGPDGWLFGAPQQLMIEGDKVQLRVPVDDKPKGAVGIVPLILTLAGKPNAAEIRFDLDISGGRQ